MTNPSASIEQEWLDLNDLVREIIADVLIDTHGIQPRSLEHTRMVISNRIEAWAARKLEEVKRGRVNFADVVAVLKKQWPWFTFSEAALAEYLGIEDGPLNPPAPEASTPKFLNCAGCGLPAPSCKCKPILENENAAMGAPSVGSEAEPFDIYGHGLPQVLIDAWKLREQEIGERILRGVKAGLEEAASAAQIEGKGTK